MRHLPLFFLSICVATFSNLSAETETSPFQLIALDKEEPVLFEEDVIDVGGLLTFEPDLGDVQLNVVETDQKPSIAFEIATEEAGALSTSLEEENSFDIADLEERNKILEKPEISKVEKKKLLNAKASAPAPEKPKKDAVAVLDKTSKQVQTAGTLQINLGQVFAGSPVIYSLLLSLSVFAFFICLYNLISLRGTPESFVRKIRQKLLSNQFDEALTLCIKEDQLFGRVLASAISVRKLGFSHMAETMKAEGKRATVAFWQRIALLNDIAIVAPMLGLLGTVLGMFYAFYDLNSSRESVNTLFDGLGISVGTTVAGLIVAILAMMLHSLSKYRLMRLLTVVEDEAQALATIIDPKTSSPERQV